MNPPPVIDPDALIRGIDNLLLTCMQLKAGETVLLVTEPEHELMYSRTIPYKVAARIQKLNAEVALYEHPLVSGVGDFSLELVAKMKRVDHVLFLSRIGDYSRFMPFSDSAKKTQCYALDEAMFASHYAGACYQLMTGLHQKLETELMQAKEWRIRCPLGTDLSGTFCWPSLQGGVDEDFSLNMFPVTTFKPIPCNTAHGRVALSRWLMPGAAVKVEPARIYLESTVMAEVQDGLIAEFTGTANDVQAVNEHYDRVANTLGINRNRVHSWHAGLNPHTFFTGCIVNDLDRWEGLSFASPRYLHLHTCGDIAPSEISWSVFNPTVEIDGETWWQDGQLVWYRRPDNMELIRPVAGGDCLLEPSQCIKV
ncbi:MAG: hypothetical protein ACPGVP_10570 [Thiolinea sp.]